MVLHKNIIKLYEFMESKAGHFFIGSVVILNSLIIGIQTFEHIPENILGIFHHADKFILCIFVIELTIKLLAGGVSFFRSGWNIFDLIIVVGSLLPNQGFLPVIRAFRLLHLMSMIDAFPKMRRLIKGFWKAVPGISHVLFILLVFFYIFSVLGVFLFRDFGAEHFQHIGVAMKTMFQVLSGDDWANVMRETEKACSYAGIYFISFYVLMSFIVLNLFIGVVVDALQSIEEEVFDSNDSQNQTDDKQVLLESLKKQIDRLEKKLDNLKS
jgi:voltage-gated sodium channel